ncbi:MAG: hypothetical protein ABL958_20700, partial [Bdellovibrionia bacterium]
HRTHVEQVLTASAQIIHELLNRDVQQVGTGFKQVLLKSPGTGGFSVWFTNPVAIAVGVQNQVIPWSSMIHEIGHNLSLNFPAQHIYGGKIDGNANAIYSECVAQILAHSAMQVLFTDRDKYGLGGDLLKEIEFSGRDSMALVQKSYRDYSFANNPFSVWNDPATAADETFGTFMTVAHVFFREAEIAGRGYKIPAKRFFHLLRLFDAAMATAYAPLTNSVQASTFRATLMVTAVSFAFEKNMKTDFEALGFPVSATIYQDLYQRASATPFP